MNPAQAPLNARPSTRNHSCGDAPTAASSTNANPCSPVSTPCVNDTHGLPPPPTIAQTDGTLTCPASRYGAPTVVPPSGTDTVLQLCGFDTCARPACTSSTRMLDSV